MFSSSMKINEKNVASFAASDSPVDKEGYLSRKSDVKGYQKRWFVLKGNLLFYYERKQDREPAGLLVLEGCGVQASASEKHGFEICFDGGGSSGGTSGPKSHVLMADDDEEMQSWMRAISHASYDFLKTIVSELQKQVDSLTSHSAKEREGGKRTSSSEKKGSPRVSRDKDSIPIRSKPKVTVENGVLVDVPGEAPPVPPKKRMIVQKSPSPEPQAARYPIINPNKPHSSPIAPPTGKGRSTLSPPGTLDRTPILLPSSKTSDDYDIPPSHYEEEESSLDARQSQPFVNLPSTHTTSVVKGMSAPPTSHSNSLQLHSDFTDAFNALHMDKSTN
ncbi:PREDICTED: sesquipedalian-1-like [Amphimedon queenslandica]|uniref:PH domain-containing protein n=1 Tax=Amphimedon queenslandica TaxID=400682 RepID=A0A1X7V0X1_AMPQE|nr:PREDICTED: sesquipedalian-1-like [Amphimedon queenslandica]|eukprot:XP_003386073.2 PREDICTED: sesquipedalian-1-like [Amphimedon queenslandica]